MTLVAALAALAALAVPQAMTNTSAALMRTNIAPLRLCADCNGAARFVVVGRLTPSRTRRLRRLLLRLPELQDLAPGEQERADRVFVRVMRLHLARPGRDFLDVAEPAFGRDLRDQRVPCLDRRRQ